MNRDDILSLLRPIKNYAGLCETLSSMNEAELFHGLFPIAIALPYGRLSPPVYDAANLLLELNPKCQLSCQEAIRAMLDDWDISLEEVPFYLYGQMGMPAIQGAFDQLRLEPLAHLQYVRLDTVLYWAKIADGEEFEALRRRIIERWREQYDRDM